MSALILAALSGALYAASFPPLAWSDLAWFALVPLFLGIARARPARAFLLGVLWFFVASLGFAASLPWLIETYFEASPLLGWVALGALTLVFGPLYGAYAAWMSWLVGRDAATPLLAGVGFAACELLRTKAGAVFGWALLAYSQAPGSRVLQIADLGGPYVVSMLFASVNYLVASFVSGRLRPARRLAWTVGVAATVLAALGYGEVRLRAEPTAGEPVRVAIVQGGIPHERLWKPEHREENLGRYLELTKRVAVEPLDLIVWPEYAIDFYLQRFSAPREQLLDVSQRLDADLLLGAPHSQLVGREVRYYNSAFLLRKGRNAGRHDKSELLPFSERNPLPGLITTRRRFFTPGGSPRALHSGRMEIGVLLCSEALPPSIARELADDGADVLANLSNDSWFGSEAAARIALNTAAERAIENRRPLLRATGSGYSAAIDAQGRIVASSSFGSAETLVTELHLSHRATVYQRLGDGAVWAGLLVALLATLRTWSSSGNTALVPR